jgi:hypothetical protein
MHLSILLFSRTSWPRALLLFLGVIVTAGATAQPSSSLYDQAVLSEILDRQGTAPDAWRMAPEDVAYAYYVLDDPSGNSVIARHRLYHKVGEGDVHLGRERLALSMLLNGAALTTLAVGDSLVLPANPSDFDLDPLVFSPFAYDYPGAADYDKLVVIDKDAQAWAAYEHGRLVRWGPSSTGAANTPTPTGRFTFNWQQTERISSESPPGEEWHMRWVMNFHFARGIHMHQYAVPTGPPAGAGCVRLVEADARWLYEWADPWTTTAGRGALGGRVLRPGTTLIVQGEEPTGPPHRFITGPDGPRRHMISLPEDPASIPRGDR